MKPLIITANGQRIYPRSDAGTAHTQIYPELNPRYIKKRSEEADLFLFTLANPCFANGSRYIPAGRDEILVFKSEDDFSNDVRWFGGVITKIADATEVKGASFIVRYEIEAQSFLVLLDKELRQPQIANKTWGELIKLLLARHFEGVIDADVSNVSNDVSAPPVKIVNSSMLNLLRAMRTLTNHEFKVDAYKKVHVFKAISKPAGFTLTDTPTGGLMPFSRYPTISREARSIFNIVRQPFSELISKDDWDGQSFTATGDPKSGQLPLNRTPEANESSILLEDKFDGNTLDAEKWSETDTNTTEHVDHPNQGFLFSTAGQLQVVGGTGSLGGVALQSQDFYQSETGLYIVQEFQLTNATGTGYLALFTDGQGLATGNFKGGLKVVDGALQALDGTVLVASLGTTTNYILWTTITDDGFQYDIHGGAYPTKQTLRTEAFSHLSDYKVIPVASVDLEGSINSFRLRRSERNLVLLVDDKLKTVGLEASDADLPDIDAFLNTDESPAVIKFKGASALAVVDSVASDTVFTVSTGQGDDFIPGQRVLVGTNIIEEFNGKAGFVASVNGDEITLVAPGITGMQAGNQVMVGTTLPAKDARIRVLYSYLRENEAVATDPDSVDKYGGIPITLPEKDHIRDLSAAQAEAEAHLERFRDGVLSAVFPSNSRIIGVEPDTLTALPVNLTKRPDPINQTLTIQQVIISPDGKTGLRYEIEAESADPVRPFEDRILDRNLVIGQDGTLRFTVGLVDKPTADDSDLVIKDITAQGLYIPWSNPNNRKYGEFKWKP